MKNVIKFILIGLFYQSSIAQVNINISLGDIPDWGPREVVDARYYYLPEVEMYFDIPSKMFIYFDGTIWVRTKRLPARYQNVNLYKTYKVCLDDYGPKPFIYFKKHRSVYHPSYRGNKNGLYHKDFYRGRLQTNRNEQNNTIKKHDKHDWKDHKNHGKGNKHRD